MIIAQTEDDVRTLRILFNNNLVRYAFIIWKKTDNKPDLPKEYKYLKSYNPLAFITIHNSSDVEDMTKPERHNRFLEEMKKDNKPSPADELSFFLDGDKNG